MMDQNIIIAAADLVEKGRGDHRESVTQVAALIGHPDDGDRAARALPGRADLVPVR